MPENHNLEISIQQKMDLFRVEPDPADWQRIYEQLHPRKNRRFFFWTFPLACALLLGGYLYSNRSSVPAGVAVPEIAATVPSTQPLASNSTDKDNSDHTTDHSSPTTVTNKTVVQEEKTSAFIQPLTASETTTPLPATPSTSNNTQNALSSVTVSRPSKNTTQTDFSKPTPKQSPHPDGSKSVATTTKTERNPETSPENSTSPNTVVKSKQELNTSSGQGSSQLTNTSTGTPPTLVPNSGEALAPATISQGAQQQMPSALQATKDSMQALTLKNIPPTKPDSAVSKISAGQKKIPNTSSHRENGWYLGGYAEIGTNKPTDPLSMAKSADLGNIQQGSNIYQATSSRSNGLHYAFGAVAEKKKKKFSYNIGLGMQQNTWSAGYVLYRDSILPNGSMFSRTQVSEKQTSYTHTALEIPVNFNFRLAGKGTSSFWLGAGLNNTFTLGLREQSKSSSTGSSAGLDNRFSDSVRTADATKYQPQLRLSLMYEHAGKSNHWQASPFLQYSISSMVKQGQPDILMLHFGLQFRYYFKRLDGRH